MHIIWALSPVRTIKLPSVMASSPQVMPVDATYHDERSSAPDVGSTDSLPQPQSSLAAPPVSRQRRRSDQPSSAGGVRPTFAPSERGSFDIAGPADSKPPSIVSIPEGGELEKTSRPPPIVVPSLASAVPVLRAPLEQLQVDDRPAPSAAERAIHRRKAAVQYAAACFALFMSGWNDGSTGPLMPTVQAFYHVSSLLYRCTILVG
jgi:hypothetical protein